MKIVIAPDSFKGSLTAKEAADAIEEGVKRVLPEAEMDKIPMADGGEGTVQALVDATNGRIITRAVCDPLGDQIEAYFGVLGDENTAVIEMATASGLPLVPEGRRNPMLTTTYGTGELIRAALDEGCRSLIVGIGGSATVDGGAGMAQALGARLLDKDGNEVPRGGGGLELLDRIEISNLDSRISETVALVACDVDNPLVGPNGAPAVYGPQKGATPEMVKKLDKYLDKYADIVKRDLRIDVKDAPGAGAAGGLGAGLMAFLGAELKSGVDIVIEASGLEKHLEGSELVITGEGKIDGQTIYGKTPIGVARSAKKLGITVIGIGGGIGDDASAVYKNGIDALISIVSYPMTLDEACERAYKLLSDAAERAIRLTQIWNKL
jgi:glycerate kinase